MKKTKLPQLTDADIRLLRVFRAVTEAKGFSNAESVLNIGRSTISAQMSLLEGRLGLRLCDRGPSGFKLTEEGKQVYAASTRLFMAFNDFRTEVDKTHGQEYLNIALIDNTITDAVSPLGAALASYAHKYPHIHLRIHTLPPDEIEERVSQGRLDAGFIPMHGESPGLLYKHVHTERNQLYCGKDHRWFAGDPPKDLADGTDFEPRHVSHGYKHAPLEKAANFGLSRDATAFSVEGIALLIMTGLYIGFLPAHYASLWVERGEMRVIHPDRYFFDAEIVAVYQRAAENKSTIKQLLHELDCKIASNNDPT